MRYPVVLLAMRIKAKALDHLLVAEHRPTWAHYRYRDQDHIRTEAISKTAKANRKHGKRWVWEAHLHTPQLRPTVEGDVDTGFSNLDASEATNFFILFFFPRKCLFFPDFFLDFKAGLDLVRTNVRIQ